MKVLSKWKQVMAVVLSLMMMVSVMPMAEVFAAEEQEETLSYAKEIASQFQASYEKQKQSMTAKGVGTVVMIQAGIAATITNAEGQVMKYDGKSGFTGDLTPVRTIKSDGAYMLTLPDSNSLTYATTTKKTISFSTIDILSLKMTVLTAANGGSITIADNNGACEMRIKTNGKYEQMSLLVGNQNMSLSGVEGQTGKQVTIVDSSKDLSITGAYGKHYVEYATVSNSDADDEGLGGEGYYYLFGSKATFTPKGTKFLTTGVSKLNDSTKKTVSSLYLRPANYGKNMMLTWSKVKGAKSYVVYQYNSATKKYKKVAVRKGRSTNYYNIENVSNQQTYHLYVRASKNANGKGSYIGSRSAAVSSVSANNGKGNAISVSVNRSKVSGKVGTTKKIKAKVKTTKGKTVCNKKVRWQVENRKIATVSKSGKVTLKKKGTTYVWAMAHNGKNSKKIKVTVK